MLLLLTMLNQTENKDERIIKFLNFCSTFIEQEIDKKYKLSFILLPFVLYNQTSTKAVETR